MRKERPETVLVFCFRFHINFSQEVAKPSDIELGGERDYGVGMFFFPQDELKRNQAKKMFEVIVEKEGMKFLGWREVPTHPENWEESSRLYAMYHAGICQKSGRSRKGTWILTASCM